MTAPRAGELAPRVPKQGLHGATLHPHCCTCVKKLAKARVKLLGLAGLDSSAHPAYDRQMTERLAACGLEIAALTPQQLARGLVKVVS